jgi:hypothetical protein
MAGRPRGDATREEEIKARLITGFHAVGSDIKIRGFVPGIDRRAERQRLLLVGRMVKNVLEFSVCSGRAQIEFADGIADTVPAIGRTVSVTSVGGARHPDANEFRGHG